ncbi:hypothetical protein K1T71_013317 [Dendrolimus kikuchii]|uniref:Uncharacterized protein n=1 Tax=Dendrolimus kikuchii TaxID=765133 RepID=A0ACC1CHW0_9NEOP|nr:hypothetical protein K1T71_013317 [Dendrolimus kikuchii]
MKNNKISSILSRQAIKDSLYGYKQIFATFASCLLFMTSGVTFGYTGVLLPQLREDTEYPYDKNLDSWIASISPLAMMAGCIGSGILSDALGRKTGQLIVIFPFIAGWLIMSFAQNNAVMLLGRFITGFCTGAVRPTTMVYIGEITSPKHRGVALACPTLAVHLQLE